MAFKEITFPDRDTMARMISRTLLQFRQSPVFLDVLYAFSLEIQRLIDAAKDVQEKRTAYSAGTAQLDAIGRIVGQFRNVPGYDLINYFTPDIPEVGDPDSAIAWVETAPLSDLLEVDNTTFSTFLEQRIAYNQTKYGSIPEIQAAAKTALDLDISIVIVGPSTIKLVVEDAATAEQILFLQFFADTKTADQVTFLPIPAGTKISQIVKLSDL